MLLIFSHGNSFPASTYGVMTASLKKRGFTVKAVEKFGHDPQYPVTDNWRHLVQQLTDFTQREVGIHGESAYLVGHSLGGFLSLMCAARHPTLVKGLVLLDAPLLGGWRATTLGAIKSTPLIGRVSPGAVSQGRKHQWDNEEAAYNHFKSKRVFAMWDEQTLRNYIAHGTHSEGGKRVLSFNREVETQIYNTLPDNLDALLKRHPLKCPAAFIGGRQSVEMQRVGTALTEKVTGAKGNLPGRMMLLDGTHLFPMEKPVATAAAIEATIAAFST
jgi:pimeloyl-ACP methyl ester carboxylesterase